MATEVTNAIIATRMLDGISDRLYCRDRSLLLRYFTEKILSEGPKTHARLYRIINQLLIGKEGDIKLERRYVLELFTLVASQLGASQLEHKDYMAVVCALN